MLNSKKQLSGFLMSALAISLLLTGCATKGFVKKQVAAVDSKVSQVSATVQENAEKLDATDTRARQGIADAAAARGAAATAQASATAANTAADRSQAAANAAQGTADTANQGAQNANSRITTVDNRFTAFEGNHDRYNAGPVTIVMFKVGKSDLSSDAKKALDEIVAPITSWEPGYLVEIQGFTSSDGPEAMNVKLSQDRSESVQRYLVSKGAPVTRIAIVGLASERPVADNNTRTGREKNRRAEVRVLTAAK
jgi:OOP family OmpA-OmpF porin